MRKLFWIPAIFFLLMTAAGISQSADDPSAATLILTVIMAIAAYGCIRAARKKKVQKTAHKKAGVTKAAQVIPVAAAASATPAPATTAIPAPSVREIPATTLAVNATPTPIPTITVQSASLVSISVTPTTITHATNKERIKKGNSILKPISDYVVLDLETTGLDPTRDEIIEVAAMRVRNHAVVDQFTSLVNPQCSITAKITELTGITNETVKDAPVIADVLPALRSFIGDDIVLGHNVNFDINFIYDKSELLGLTDFSNDFFDTLRLSRRLYPDERHHRLQDMVNRLNVGIEVSHRAMSDIEQTKACYDAMLEEMQSRKANSKPHTAKSLPDDPLAGIDKLDSLDIYLRGIQYRKAGRLDEALVLFDKAKSKGLMTVGLYESYALIYRKMKNYHKEIEVLDEGIATLNSNSSAVALLRERREKAMQLLEKEQSALEKAQVEEGPKQAKQATKLRASEESDAGQKKHGRAILQLSDDMTIIQRYDSITEAAQTFGISTKSIRDAANGVQKHAGGAVWRFEDSM